MNCRKPHEREALTSHLGDTHNRPAPTSFLMGQMWQEHIQQIPINTVIEVPAWGLSYKMSQSLSA
ncbi:MULTISPECIES: hypothetical protein [unclassified Halomonas]|uniref:hypothetical protein n=1 Tax=unclassified Halomonas TaxID=2609666 RepID=UPI0005FCD472|nr:MULTISPECIES: hypothetical protein [unclassified Halomonas]CEP35160.1 Putative uncharacterized protein [Halomonas sp. R57-5]